MLGLSRGLRGNSTHHSGTRDSGVNVGLVARAGSVRGHVVVLKTSATRVTVRKVALNSKQLVMKDYRTNWLVHALRVDGFDIVIGASILATGRERTLATCDQVSSNPSR